VLAVSDNYADEYSVLSVLRSFAAVILATARGKRIICLLL
jgi:hypothetical protein